MQGWDGRGVKIKIEVPPISVAMEETLMDGGLHAVNESSLQPTH